MSKSTMERTLFIAESHPLLRAALLAFIAGLPFTSGSFTIVGYYWAFLLVFCIAGFWGLRHQAGAFSGLRARQPLASWLLPLWALSTTVSLLNVFLFTEPSGFHQFTSIVRYLYDLVLVAFCLIVARLVACSALSIADVCRVLAVGLVMMVIFHIYVYQAHGIDGDTWFATPPLGPHIRDQGNLACAVIAGLSAIFMLGRERRVLPNVLTLYALLVAWSFLLWTGGRMGIVSSIVTVAVLAVWISVAQPQARSQTLARAGILLVLLPIAFVISEAFAVFDWNGIGRTLAFTQHAEHLAQGASQQSAPNLNKLTTGRADMWMMSLNAMWQQPWFGLGPYGYFFIPERTYDDQPHNFLVQFLVEWGVVGAGVMVTMMLVVLVQVFRTLTDRIRIGDEGYLVAAAVVLVLTLHGFTGGTYFKIQPITLVALGYAGLLGQYLRQKPRQSAV